MTACAATFWSTAICSSVNGRISWPYTEIAPRSESSERNPTVRRDRHRRTSTRIRAQGGMKRAERGSKSGLVVGERFKRAAGDRAAGWYRGCAKVSQLGSNDKELAYSAPSPLLSGGGAQNLRGNIGHFVVVLTFPKPGVTGSSPVGDAIFHRPISQSNRRLNPGSPGCGSSHPEPCDQANICRQGLKAVVPFARI